MQKIEKFKADDGREFKTEKECRQHEAIIAEADKIFRDWPIPVQGDCSFSNGDGYITLDKDMYERARKEFLELVLKEFRGKDMQKVVEATRNMDSNWGIIGRYLDDSDTPLYHYWCQFLNCEAGNPHPTGEKKYRLWGQGYYALNPDKGKQVEWKKVKKWGAK
jgi:hypothetical protein